MCSFSVVSVRVSMCSFSVVSVRFMVNVRDDVTSGLKSLVFGACVRSVGLRFFKFRF